MNVLSNRLNSLSPSATLAMSQKSAELKAQGVDVINLSVGEPDFNTPDHIKEAAKKAIDDNYSRYSPVPGYPALRNAIVAKLKNENNLEYTAAQISCANGAKQSVCNTILALVNPGEEVIVPAPYWVSYPEMVKLADGVSVFVETTEAKGFKFDIADLKKALTDKTKALVLNNPSNPTGMLYTKEELKNLKKDEEYKYLFNLIEMPAVLALFLVGAILLVAGVVLTLLKPKFTRGIWLAGPGTVFVVMALFMIAGYNGTAYYPSTADLQSSLTIQNSSSSEFTLTAMSIVSLIIPFVVAYIAYFWYKMDRRSLTAQELKEEETY